MHCCYDQSSLLPNCDKREYVMSMKADRCYKTKVGQKLLLIAKLILFWVGNVVVRLL